MKIKLLLGLSFSLLLLNTTSSANAIYFGTKWKNHIGQCLHYNGYQVLRGLPRRHATVRNLEGRVSVTLNDQNMDSSVTDCRKAISASDEPFEINNNNCRRVVIYNNSTAEVCFN